MAAGTRKAHTRTTADGKVVKVSATTIAGGRAGSKRGGVSDPDQVARLRTQAAAQAAQAGGDPDAADFYLFELEEDDEPPAADAPERGGRDGGDFLPLDGPSGRPAAKKRRSLGRDNSSGMQVAMRSWARRMNGGGGGRGAQGKLSVDPDATTIGKLLKAFGGGGKG